MNLLSVENLKKSFGDRLLFQGLSFGLAKGQKAALVAANGSGKTTLLQILVAFDSPDSGEVRYRKGIKVGYLPQEPILNPDNTVLDALFNTENVLLKTIRKYEAALESPENTDQIQATIEEMDLVGAWDYEAKVREILTRLEINHLTQQIYLLSGGQRKRIALAQTLIDKPDLLILDEPTNHLDLEMIEWLENYLAQDDLTLLLVTHDRYFLECVCDTIFELTPEGLYTYEGNYSYFLEKKAERQFNEKREIEKAKSLARIELEWIRRQPKARGTKAKARIDAFNKLEEKANQKTEIIEPFFDIKMNRIGGKIFEIKNVTHQFDTQIILKNFSYTFKPKDRIGIIGKNGTGKSTFLNLLSGIEIPQAGSIVPGETVVIGYYQQQGLAFDENTRVLDVITGIAEAIPVNKGESITASQLLGRFGFPVSMQHSPVRKLSGGEKRRLYLLTVLMRNPNVLLLDEPTNDLDLLTLQLLEAFLVEYQGSLVVVSHDRYFMDRLVEHLFIFEGNGIIQDFPGNYSQYREKMMQQLTAMLKPEIKQTKSTNEKAQQRQTGKLSSKERKRYELLEQEIEKAEAQKITLTNQLSVGETHHSELLAISQQIEAIQRTIDKLTEEWLILAERI